MNLRLSEFQRKLQATTFEAFDGAVNWTESVVRRRAEANFSANARDILDLTAKCWAAAPEPGDERLLSAVLVCESIGRSFAPISVRMPLMVQWLDTAVRRSGSKIHNAADCLLSIKSDEVGGSTVLKAAIDSSGRYQLRGERMFVEGSAHARALVLDAWTERGSGLFLVDLGQDGVVQIERDVLDSSLPAFGLSLGQGSPAVGEMLINGPSGHDHVCELVDIGRVLTAAEMIGIADMVLTLATGYARARHQFDRPIGHFQSVSHACAEMLCDVELARSLLYAIAAKHRGDGVPPRADAAMVKALAARVCPKVADRGLHIFGAEGATWDRGIHFAVRRLQTLRLMWGDADACEQQLDDGLE